MKRLLFARVAAVACLSMLTLLPAQGEEAPASLLWRDVPSPSQDPPLPPRKPWVIRDREIVFNPQLLAILKDASARPHPPLFIELFQARPYELDVSATVSRLSDLSTIKGTIKQSAHATWSLVINGSIVSGTFQLGDRLYKIEHVQNGRHRLSEVDPAKMPAE